AELQFDKTPYRFAFNNPAFWSDPTGLYEFVDNGVIRVNSQEEIQFLLQYLQNGGSTETNAVWTALVGEGFAMDLEGVEIVKYNYDKGDLAFSNKCIIGCHQTPGMSRSVSPLYERTPQTFYQFSNSLIIPSDGFQSDFLKPGDKIETIELPSIGGDAVGAFFFEFLKNTGILKKEERMIEQYIDRTIVNRDSLNTMSVQDIGKYGRTYLFDSIYFKGTLGELYDTVNKVNFKHGDTMLWERGYIFKS